MEEFTTLVIVPIITAIISGVAVLIIEYWFIQPKREQQNKKGNNTKKDDDSTSNTTKEPNTKTQAPSSTKQNSKTAGNQANVSFFSITGIYPINSDRLIASLLLTGSLFLTAAAISFERLPDRFPILLLISGAFWCLASVISLYMDRNKLRDTNYPAWQMALAVTMIVLFSCCAPFYVLVAINSLLGIKP